MTHMLEAAPRKEEDMDLIMNALVLYDDPELATRTKALLEQAGQRAGGALHWTLRPWRLDMMILPSMADAALADAARAHLVVLALNQPRGLPIWLPDWLEQWAERRHVSNASLAVLSEGNGSSLLVGTATALARLAQRHGVTFICEEAELNPEPSPAHTGVPPERERPHPERLVHILKQPVHDLYRHWGINE